MIKFSVFFWLVLIALLFFNFPLYADIPLNETPFPKVKAPKNISYYIKNKSAAIKLGKAFFWDMQAGSDGVVACATCHSHAFSDNRTQNQLHPGPDNYFSVKGLNQIISASDFPFYSDDIFGSQGVVKAVFNDIVIGKSEENYNEILDPVFNINNKNIRQVTAMRSPTVINAALNHRNFWDGRANQIFNGVTPFGVDDPNSFAKTWEAPYKDYVRSTSVALEYASLASQAVGPMLNTEEMSYKGRTWPKIAKKMLSLVPLQKQFVHPNDSVLGQLSKAPERGLKVSYREMIKKAFQPWWWNSTKSFKLKENAVPEPQEYGAIDPQNNYSLIDINFSLFWGLAIQMYEETLISDDTPFDRFRRKEYDPRFTGLVQKGMEIFNKGEQCSSCHREVIMASATWENIDKLGVSISRYTADNALAFLDTGFFNIGVRPTNENLGVGGNTPFNTPLSFSKVLHPNDRLAINGAFKAPGLRNVALRGPYFHTGGKANLDQVLDFYRKKGDFHDQNFLEMNINMEKINFTIEEQEALKAFLLVGLTDERVTNESAPFDHPEIFLPNGYLNGNDRFLILPAVGEQGRSYESLPPLRGFLETN